MRRRDSNGGRHELSEKRKQLLFDVLFTPEKQMLEPCCPGAVLLPNTIYKDIINCIYITFYGGKTVMRKISLKVAIFLLMLSLIGAPSLAAAKSIELKLSHATPRSSTWHQGAEKFANIIKEKTSAKYDIKIYPSDELSGGNQVAGIELLQTGVTDIHMQDALVWSAIAKKSILPCFPWLLPSYKDVDKVMQGEGGKALKKVISDVGVICLAIGENGYRQVVNNRNPIRKPSDMKGLKMRVPGSNVHVNLLKYIGADPITMNQSEVYTSLQQGTIDACENTLDLLFTQNTLEVVKYISLWNYSYDPIYFSVSTELWEKLSPEERDIFQKAATEAMAYQVKVTREKEQLLHKRLVEYKINVVNELLQDDLAAFKKAVSPIYKDYKNDFGEEIFKQFGYKF